MPESLTANLYYADLGKDSFACFFALEEGGKPKAAWKAYETQGRDEFTPYKVMRDALKKIVEEPDRFNRDDLTPSPSGRKREAYPLMRKVLDAGLDLAPSHVRAYVGYGVACYNKHPWASCRPSDIRHLAGSLPEKGDYPLLLGAD